MYNAIYNATLIWTTAPAQASRPLMVPHSHRVNLGYVVKLWINKSHQMGYLYGTKVRQVVYISTVPIKRYSNSPVMEYATDESNNQ